MASTPGLVSGPTIHHTLRLRGGWIPEPEDMTGGTNHTMHLDTAVNRGSPGIYNSSWNRMPGPTVGDNHSMTFSFSITRLGLS